MSEPEGERLARIEEMLRAHFSRDDERWGTFSEVIADVQLLKMKAAEQKGAWALLSLVTGIAAAFGGLFVKFWPFGAH